MGISIQQLDQNTTTAWFKEQMGQFNKEKFY
jgi:hypothetical protein